MKNLTRTTLLSFLLLTGTQAFAGPEHPGHGRGESTANPVARELAGTLRQLELSEDQKAAIKEIVAENREVFIAQAEARKALQEEMVALLNAPLLDEDALAELAEREGNLAEERVVLTGTLISNVQAELDEAQLAELAILREERLEQRSERRGRFAGKDGG